jgi:hypothetical protein
MTDGQSNNIGHGAYVDAWPDYPTVRYWVAGVPTPFAPNPADLGLALGGANTHGPELGIGRAAAQAGARASICKAGHDSYTIEQLMTGTEWNHALACIAALKPLASSYHYVWTQGEANAVLGGAGYEAELKAMFAQVRTAFGTERVRFEVLLLNRADANLKNAAYAAGVAAVRAAELAAVAKDANAVLISADDKVPTLGNGWHYDSPEELVIGERVFAAR